MLKFAQIWQFQHENGKSLHASHAFFLDFCLHENFSCNPKMLILVPSLSINERCYLTLCYIMLCYMYVAKCNHHLFSNQYQSIDRKHIFTSFQEPSLNTWNMLKEVDHVKSIFEIQSRVVFTITLYVKCTVTVHSTYPESVHSTVTFFWALAI